MPRRSKRRRVALVLGSGGIVGGAYHAGVLKALYDTWHIDPREVDLIVGTSAGSIAGTLTAAGLHPNDLFRRETGKPLSPGGQRLLSRGRARRGAKPTPRSTIGRPAAPEALLNAARNPRGVALGSLTASMMPRGNVSTAHVAGMIEGIFGDTWPPAPRLRVCGVELTTARRVVFGGDTIEDLGARAIHRPATPAQAVAASCAVPGVFEPVTIDDREYHDGGVHSADNLDLVGSTNFDLVVVSSPMSSHKPMSGNLPLLALREMSRWQTAREKRTLSNCDRIEILRPNAEDLDAMGTNMLDPRRRPAVAFQAHASACALLSRRPAPFSTPSPSEQG